MKTYKTLSSVIRSVVTEGYKKDNPPFEPDEKSSFKKPDNKNRTGMDAARALARKAMQQKMKESFGLDISEEEADDLLESIEQISKENNMKPTVNYGLSDSLIDAVRKSVEEALVGGQKKLDVDKDGKLEKTDFASLRAKKDVVTIKPKLKEEEQIDELSNDLIIRAKNKARARQADATNNDNRRAAQIHRKQGDRLQAGLMRNYDKQNDADEMASLSPAKRRKMNKEESEQMDEAPLRAVNALVGYPKLNKKVAAKGTPGSEDERNKAAAGLKRDRSGLGRAAYTGTQHYDVRREEEEQMDEVKLADLPRRKVVGKSYGADYVDPEGADETAADMKKAEPKRKSGPQGTMKRRFIKDKSKLRMQYK